MRRALIENSCKTNVILNGELLYTCTPGDRLSHVVNNTIMDEQDFITHKNNILYHNKDVFRELCMSTNETDPVIPRPFATIAIPPVNQDKGARYLTDAAIRRHNRMSFNKRFGWHKLLASGVNVADFAAASAVARTTAFLNQHANSAAGTIDASAILVGLSDNTMGMISTRATILKDALKAAESVATKYKNAAIGERNGMKKILESTLENVNHKFRRIIPGLKQEMNLSARLKYALNDPHYARVKYACGKLSFINNEVYHYLGEVAEKAENLSKHCAIVGAGIALIDAGIDGVKQHSWKVFGEEAAKGEAAYAAGWGAGEFILTVGIGGSAIVEAPAILVVGAAFGAGYLAEAGTKWVLNNIGKIR